MASRHVVLGLDGPGVPWRTGFTTPTHQPAIESSPFGTPIRVIGGHLAESTGAILKGGTAQHRTARETRNKDVVSALVHERLEAHGDPRDRVCIVGFKLSANKCLPWLKILRKVSFVRGTRLIWVAGCHNTHTHTHIIWYRRIKGFALHT